MASSPHYDYGLFWRAIAISLLLHAVLMLQPGFDVLSSHPAAEQSLIALLRPRPESRLQGAVAAVPVSHATHAPAAVRERPSAATPVSTPATPPLPIAVETVNNTAGSANVSNDANNAAADDVSATEISALNLAEARKSYLFAIAAEARRVKKYPPRALTAGWTGTAEIHVSVAAGGNVQAPQLQKSSGYADIDNAALSFVGVALKRTLVPEILHGRNFDFVLPVSFTINDE